MHFFYDTFAAYNETIMAFGTISAFALVLMVLSDFGKRRFPWLGRFAKRLFWASAICGLSVYAGIKPPRMDISYDNGIRAGQGGSYITNDTVYVSWQRDISQGIYIPDSATVYGEYRLTSDTNGEWTVLFTSTMGAGSWSGTVANATNYSYNVWANYVPPEPVHTNGVWTYKTMLERNGKNALPLRARIEVNGQAIATPCEKRKDEENDD